MFSRLIRFCSYSTNVHSVTRDVMKQNRPPIKKAPKRSRNPGARKLTSLRREEDKYADLDELDAEELHEEGDFMEGDALLDEHTREINERRQKFGAQRKYFRSPKEVSLLTWSEKEQIRLLHQLDPKEWCPERLANSFPVSVLGVKRILHANWKPNRENFVEKHDKAVAQNWKKIAEGEIQLSPDLKHLIEKANNRKYVPNPAVPLNVPGTCKQPPLLESKSGEYKSIVYEYKRRLEGNHTSQLHSQSRSSNVPLLAERNSAVGGVNNLKIKAASISGRKAIGHTHVTLETYKSKCFGIIQKNDNTESPQTSRAATADEVEIDDKDELYIPSKYKKSETVNLMVEEEGKKKEAYLYNAKYGYQRPLNASKEGEDHIIIPKDMWKKDALYRIGDSYYDDSGEFLYAVPGMK